MCTEMKDCLSLMISVVQLFSMLGRCGDTT